MNRNIIRDSIVMIESLCVAEEATLLMKCPKKIMYNSSMEQVILGASSENGLRSVSLTVPGMGDVS